MATTEAPKNHMDIDWFRWAPPGEGEVRSPCPALNALANHHILPHNGRGITKASAATALTSALHLDSTLASILSAGGVASNPDHSTHTFDLDHLDTHGYIEHDGSLSRDDAALGSNSAFSKAIFDGVLADYKAEGAASTSWEMASHVRYARLVRSKQAHAQHGKEWTYGLKEAIFSYGESALYLNLLGKDGVTSLDWVRIFFEEGRLPYAEGWRPPPMLNQSMLNHAYLKMIEANEHKIEEAKLTGMGTFEALRTGIWSLIRDHGCRHW